MCDLLIPGKVTLAMLPPCKVCGEKSSGFHYGVNTCEACKVSYHIEIQASVVQNK